MFKFLGVLCLAAAALGTGDFIVLHTPKTVIFKGNEALDQSFLKEVLSASLGFTASSQKSWSGMTITDPFKPPEAIVAIAIEDVDSLKDSPLGKRFPLNSDEVEEYTWQALSQKMQKRYTPIKLDLVRFYLGDGIDALGQSALGELKINPINDTLLKALNRENDDHRKFLEEIQILNAIAENVNGTIKPDMKPDVYWLVVSGLRLIIDQHGKDSEVTKEALSFFNEAVENIKESYKKIYKNQVLVVAFTNNASKYTRNTRSVILDRFPRAANDTPKEEKIETTTESKTYEEESEILNVPPKENITLEEDTTHLTKNDSKSYDSSGFLKELKPEEMNLSKIYTANYPIMFNIMLWFCVIFFFALFAVCLVISQMDPGRDSIIYRMTANRMKKEN